MEKTREQLILELQKFRDENKIPQSKLAKKLGINEGRLSSWLNGTYRGVNEEIDALVEKFLTQESQKSDGRIKDFNFQQTTVAQRVFVSAQACHMDSIMGICYGDPGLGKTQAIKEYAKNNQGVVLIDCEEKMPKKLLIETLFNALNLGFDKRMRTQDMKEKILHKLKDSGWLLIVDEAEWLNADSFTVLRKLHDKANRTFGIMFVGTQKLYNNLISFKGDYLYLTSRIELSTALDKLDEEDMKLIIKDALPEAEEEIVEEFIKKSNNNTRVLTNILRRSLTANHRHQRVIDGKLIESCRRMMIV